jgi:hypothetical protein
MEVVAWYDRDDPTAAEWVKLAQEVSVEVWSKLNERRKGIRTR